MSMQQLSEAVQIIEEHPEKAFFVGTRPETLVRAAEQELGLQLPETYREFVLRLGAGNFGSAEFYGVTDNNYHRGAVPNGIWFTLTERQEVGLPRNLVVIGSTGDGDLYCLHVGNNEESPVIIYQPGIPENEQARELVARDFGEFLLQKLKAELETS
jgi:antitoxin YobK